MTTEYEVYPVEWLLFGLAVLCGAIGLAGVLQRPEPPEPASRIEAWRRAALTPIGIAFVLFAAHNAMLLVVWTWGNNDPLHSRYLWPSYPLLLLLGLAAYAGVRASWPHSFWRALPFRLLLALLLVVHVQRSLAAPQEPVGLYVEPEAETLER